MSSGETLSNINTESGVNEQFVRQLTACQSQLYAYVLSLLPDPERARDVVQEANVVMWRKASEFRPGTNFNAWARKIAYLEVLSERRRRRTDRHIFDDETLVALAQQAELQLDGFDERSLALDECLQRLTSSQRHQLMERYTLNCSLAEMARARGQSAGAVATALYRLRNLLLECVRNKLARPS
jgi:RNA polymerase sigma-70 factor (ECF subfamily)